MKPSLDLTERFIEGLENYNLTLEEIQNGSWRYCGGSGEQRHKNYFKTVFGNDDYPDPDDHCVCGHYIEENCYIYNPDSGEILIIGNCCIKKFIPKSGRTCEQCGESHRNRKDNLCNNCREKKEQEIKLKSKEAIPISKIKMPKKEQTKEQTKEYTVSGNTLIGWGKLKGKPHSAFLQRENENYKNWVLNQGDEFRYANTRDWILKQKHGKEPNNIQITANEKQDAEVWKELKRKLEEVLNDYPEFNLTFEF
jgi:hypothetical protein